MVSARATSTSPLHNVERMGTKLYLTASSEGRVGGAPLWIKVTAASVAGVTFTGSLMAGHGPDYALPPDEHVEIRYASTATPQVHIAGYGSTAMPSTALAPLIDATTRSTGGFTFKG